MEKSFPNFVNFIYICIVRKVNICKAVLTTKHLHACKWSTKQRNLPSLPYHPHFVIVTVKRRPLQNVKQSNIWKHLFSYSCFRHEKMQLLDATSVLLFCKSVKRKSTTAQIEPWQKEDYHQYTASVVKWCVSNIYWLAINQQVWEWNARDIGEVRKFWLWPLKHRVLSLELLRLRSLVFCYRESPYCFAGKHVYFCIVLFDGHMTS